MRAIADDRLLKSQFVARSQFCISNDRHMHWLLKALRRGFIDP